MTIYKSDTKLGDIRRQPEEDSRWELRQYSGPGGPRGGECSGAASLFYMGSSVRIRKLPPPTA